MHSSYINIIYIYLERSLSKMVKLICKKCGKIWYTSNTKPDQKCSDCNGILVEDTLFNSEVKKDMLTYNKNRPLF